jgi:hypothetical protein
MKGKTRFINRVMILVALSLLLAPATLVSAIGEPVYGSATVDGDYGEWAGDPVFAPMYRAGDPDKDVLANLWLRFECPATDVGMGTMYALVLSEPEGNRAEVQASWDEAWIALGNLSNKVTFDQKAWVIESALTVGWEASFALAYNMSYTIKAHTNVRDGAFQTAESCDPEDPTCGFVPLEIICRFPTSVDLASFEAAAKGNAIELTWETALSSTPWASTSTAPSPPPDSAPGSTPTSSPPRLPAAPWVPATPLSTSRWSPA